VLSLESLSSMLLLEEFASGSYMNGSTSLLSNNFVSSFIS
jgi:hypothetical protein